MAVIETGDCSVIGLPLFWGAILPVKNSSGESQMWMLRAIQVQFRGLLGRLGTRLVGLLPLVERIVSSEHPQR